VARQMWIAEMDAATKAAQQAEGISINEIESVVWLETPVDTERSIRFRRRKRRTTL
jgi:hypothetical protein